MRVDLWFEVTLYGLTPTLFIVIGLPGNDSRPGKPLTRSLFPRGVFLPAN
jgi:hypothetical protein